MNVVMSIGKRLQAHSVRQDMKQLLKLSRLITTRKTITYYSTDAVGSTKPENISELWCYVPQNISNAMFLKSKQLIDNYNRNKNIVDILQFYDTSNFTYEDDFVLLKSSNGLQKYFNLLSKWITFEFLVDPSNMKVHPRLVGSERNCFHIQPPSSANSSSHLLANKYIIPHQVFLELRIKYKYRFFPYQGSFPTMLVLSFNDDFMVTKHEFKNREKSHLMSAPILPMFKSLWSRILR